MSSMLATWENTGSQCDSLAINVPERGLRKTCRMLYSVGHGSKRWSSVRRSWLAWMRLCCCCRILGELPRPSISLRRLTKGCRTEVAFRMVSFALRCLNFDFFWRVYVWLANSNQNMDRFRANLLLSPLSLHSLLRVLCVWGCDMVGLDLEVLLLLFVCEVSSEKVGTGVTPSRGVQTVHVE